MCPFLQTATEKTNVNVPSKGLKSLMLPESLSGLNTALPHSTDNIAKQQKTKNVNPQTKANINLICYPNTFQNI